jgi:hypothetical protein
LEECKVSAKFLMAELNHFTDNDKKNDRQTLEDKTATGHAPGFRSPAETARLLLLGLW